MSSETKHKKPPVSSVIKHQNLTVFPSALREDETLFQERRNKVDYFVLQRIRHA